MRLLAIPSLVVAVSSLTMNPRSLAADQVTFVDRPATEPANPQYPANRTPLLPSPFIKLPLTAIHPHGWLRKQLELQAAGFHGHLTEISAFLNKDNNAWLSPSGEGRNGWEEVPYWLKGFADCAYLLGDQDQIREAKLWIEGAIASQRADGYFGPRPGSESTVSSTTGKYDLWPNMVMLMCLQSYYEFTNDPRVIDLMTRYFKWQLTVPEADFLPPYWQKIRAGDNLWSVHWLYNRTGEPWLLQLAEKIHRHTANFTDGIPDWHNVNLSQAFGGPTFFWVQSRDPQHLAASERNWQTIRAAYGQVPGGMFGGDENCRPGYTDPRQAIETCGMVEMMFSHERLLLVTGNPVWADRCEDVAYNSLPAALTADFGALRYLTAPNLILSDRHNKAPGYQNGGPMLHLNPHSHRCCQHNVGHGWPYLAEHAWLATSDAGLAVALYTPSEVRARIADGKTVHLTQDTHYPFSETIDFTIQTPQRVQFPLYLRVPGWCPQASLSINQSPQTVPAKNAGYLRIHRTWSDGDRVRLTLPMTVAVRTWTNNHNSVSIDRGPLTYSLKLGERYDKQGGTERWPAWEIHPTSPWNYALAADLTHPAAAFKVINKPWPSNEMPFTHEGTPIELVTQARRLPEWQADHLGLVGLLQPSPARTTEPIETITLIPMGAARLRIASFPVAGTGPDAHPWKGPPPSHPYHVTASHCNESDTPYALKDMVLPRSSSDPTIPRFTWWNHQGTAEWVQYDFDKTRRVSAVGVYWFDDTPAGGCAVPQSWRLRYLDGSTWREVANPQGGGVAKNILNRLSFDPIETRALRLEVQLQPNLSGGILEWQVHE